MARCNVVAFDAVDVVGGTVNSAIAMLSRLTRSMLLAVELLIARCNVAEFGHGRSLLVAL